MEKYEVIGTLGEGSFGRVYRAKQLATQTHVALKVISKVSEGQGAFAGLTADICSGGARPRS